MRAEAYHVVTGNKETSYRVTSRMVSPVTLHLHTQRFVLLIRCSAIDFSRTLEMTINN